MSVNLKFNMMKKKIALLMLPLMLPAYHVNARCHWDVYTGMYGMKFLAHDYIDILFVVNNASDQWMYLWMGHPKHGEDNGNLNLKPHSSARAIGCSNGAGYAVTGIIVTQGKDVLYTFDVNAPAMSAGYVNMHTWKGGCYVAWESKGYPSLEKNWPPQWDMSKMEQEEDWNPTKVARVRIDCV